MISDIEPTFFCILYIGDRVRSWSASRRGGSSQHSTTGSCTLAHMDDSSGKHLVFFWWCVYHTLLINHMGQNDTICAFKSLQVSQIGLILNQSCNEWLFQWSCIWLMPSINTEIAHRVVIIYFDNLNWFSISINHVN